MIRTGFQLSLLFYALTGIIVWFLSPFIASLLRIGANDLRFICYLMAAFFLRDFGFFVQQINYRTARIFFIEAVFFIGSIIGFLILTNREQISAQDLLTVNIIAMSGSSLLATSFGLGITRFFHFDMDASKKIIRYGFKTLPIGLSVAAVESADSLILGAIYNPAVVGVYGGAKRIYRIVNSLTQAAGILILPYASRLSAAKRFDDLKELFEKSTVYIWISLTGFTVIGWILSRQVFSFLGEAYSGSTIILIIMLIAAPFEGVYQIVGNILYGRGRAGRVALVSICNLLIFLALLLPLSYFFSGRGAAFALVAATTISGIWLHQITANELNSGIIESVRRFLINIRLLPESGSRDG